MPRRVSDPDARIACDLATRFIGPGGTGAEELMRNEDDQASTTPVRSAALGSHPAEPIGWSTPLRFDPDLVRELLSQHERLDRLLDTLPSRCDRARERDTAL